MRDMNEHAIEYFKGKGQRPQDWIYADPGKFQADASSTIGTKIGGRLDWVELGAAAERPLGKAQLKMVRFIRLSVPRPTHMPALFM
jgi:hypothetical protein